MDLALVTPRRMARLGPLLLLTAISCGRPPPREVELKRLDESIVAPCCWRDTLATHDSPAARALREHVHARLLRGDTREAILADLEAQHGPRIRAAPSGFSWTGFGLALFLVPLGGGALLLGRAARGTGARTRDSDDDRSAEGDRSERAARGDAELEDRLDDEIAALD